MTTEAKVLARMERTPLPLRLSEIAQGAGVTEHEARLALVQLGADGKVEPCMWRPIKEQA